MISGVVVVDKPAGPTSHDVVDAVRRVLGERRVGHTGTLDPFATGVLPICVGKATRLARFLGEGEKTYRAVVRLGFATTTDDLTGAPIGSVVPVDVDLVAVRVACARLTGSVLQRPPLYSAKRVEGRRLYEWSRDGVALDVAPTRVEIRSLDVIALEGDRVTVDVVCSTGTYVRSVARDLGADLGVGAHLVALRRFRSGEFGLEDALPWEQLDAAGRRLRPLSTLLARVPAVVLTQEGTEFVRHGRALVATHLVSAFPRRMGERVRLLDESGELLGLALAKGGDTASAAPYVEPTLHPDVVLAS